MLVSWEVGGGGALHSVLGWHHGGACARQVGSVGVFFFFFKSVSIPGQYVKAQNQSSTGPTILYGNP